MEPNVNEEFLQLVKDIVYWGNIEEEEICIRVGRNPGYISQTKSRIKAGATVPESFVNLLRLEFAEELKRKNSGSAMVADIPTKTLELLIRVLSKVNVLFVSESEKLAKMSGQDPDEVLSKMNDDATEAASSLFDELTQK
jgi:hypothetical protein